MTLTRTRRKALIIAAVCAVIAGTLFVVSQTSRSTFPGTDVEFFTASAQPGVVDCEYQPDTLERLVAESDLIVLGTVTSEQPLFEPVYGTDLPREVDGVLPERRSDFLPAALEIDVGQVLSGTMPESLQVQGAGWVAMNTSDTWHRFGMNGNPEVSVGDRAVLPLFLDPATNGSSYGVSCTGAFIIEDGEVQPRDHGLEFKDDGVYSMTEEELVSAIQKLAG